MALTIEQADTLDAGRVKINKLFYAVNQQIDSYTLVLGDAFKTVEISKATAVNLTVPANADVAFEVGTIIYLKRTGAGVMTIVQGSGVTVTASSGLLTDAGQNVVMTLIKTGTNTWDLQNGASGSLTAWTPTFAGFSASPTVTARYLVVGKLCFFWLSATGHGTSNSTSATGKTFTLPFTSATGTTQWMACGRITDSGTGQAGNGMIAIPSNSNIATVYRDGSLITLWTGSGNCSWNCSGSFEIA